MELPKWFSGALGAQKLEKMTWKSPEYALFWCFNPFHGTCTNSNFHFFLLKNFQDFKYWYLFNQCIFFVRTKFRAYFKGLSNELSKKATSVAKKQHFLLHRPSYCYLQQKFRIHKYVQWRGSYPEHDRKRPISKIYELKPYKKILCGDLSNFA